MMKLKLGAIADDKPVKLTIEIPAVTHRSLVAYAAAIAKESGQPAPDPTKIVAPMLEKFMATDRAFGRLKKPRLDKAASAARSSSDTKPESRNERPEQRNLMK